MATKTKKPRFSWRLNPPETGLAAYCAGPRGSTLRVDGVQTATVGISKNPAAWFWVVGWDSEIPLYNSSAEGLWYDDDTSAKAAATAYVRKYLETGSSI
jgi:hypothetical protein